MAEYYHNLEERRRETVAAIQCGRRTSLRRISLHIVSDCSLRCEYCRAKRVNDKLSNIITSIEWNGAKINRRRLNPLVLERIEEAADIGVQHIHIIGGEPTVVADLPDLIEKASKYRINTSLVTNGASLNTQQDEYQEKLISAGLGTLTVSLDSPNSKYNDRLVRVIGAHKVTVDFIKGMIRKRDKARKLETELPIYINTVVDNENLKNLADHLSFLHDLGVTDVKLLIVKKAPDRWISMENYEKFKEKDVTRLIETSDSYGFNMFSDDVSVLLDQDDEMKERIIHGGYYRLFYTPCYLSLSELCIVSNGDVYTCIYHFWDGKPSIGMNIISQTLTEIWEKYHPLDHNNPSVCGNNCTRKVIEINRKMLTDLKSPKYGKQKLIEAIQQGDKIPLTKLEIAISNTCTFACDYCTEITLKRATIRREKVLSLVDEASELGTELISLTGGEPTIADYLSELISYLRGKGILSKVTTSGYGRNAQNENYLKQLLEAGLDFLTSSYYSLNTELYAYVTGRRDAKKQVEGFIRKLQKLKSNGHDCYWNINILVDNLNYRQLPATIKFLSQFDGIDRTTPLVVKRKADRFLSRKDINIYYLEILPAIESLWLESRFPLMYRECRKLFGKTEEDYARTEQGLYWIADAKRCYHNYNSLFIANDGNAYHCFVFHIHQGNTLGSIHKLSLKEIWSKHQDMIVTLNPSTNPICQVHRCNPDITSYNHMVSMEVERLNND
jgi:MoaA/NifB/PqqE/SkfB family radical SAM enzyme